ncbi:aspartyl/asparaginyl beta-hydroxylase domain-containing protein [Hyphococcus flavus]|uniref:Aspartyl/asparaginyl beta-hydroxylase domain-containing protein n=1 Tax=Hyphococcus flavus TaxID=1866326 RepID=A0AAE9ZIA6_9PROT|nr:aspartyl/asparaginyl beta-hydroxylase domain-containing protein [Hyphococcus flavus]WDI33202.1 aspartyl/asparaginyl beta-hydroxylase domain-containing protein [Hyphococcus flavus]
MLVNQLISDANQALQSGNAMRALSLFTEAAGQAPSDRNVLVGLALSARALQRHDEMLKAAERLVEIEPANWQALILMADALQATGKKRRAAAAYLKAVNSVTDTNQFPPQALADLNRARQACAEAAVEYEDFLRTRIKELGVFDGRGHSRGEQAIEILLGRKQIFLQQPEKLYFPELPQIQFYDATKYEWTQKVIEQTDSIKDELLGVLAKETNFEPYVPKNAENPHVQNNRLEGNTEWGAFHLIKEGIVQEHNATLCPITMTALKEAPAPQVPGQSPVALFSRLKPGAHIPPHHGLLNTRLICHLPLIAPEGCILRVGNQERSWRPGEMLMFDDSIEHEASNPTNNERVVLLFDIWRPELTKDDRAFITTVFQAIDEFGVF